MERGAKSLFLGELKKWGCEEITRGVYRTSPCKSPRKLVGLHFPCCLLRMSLNVSCQMNSTNKQ